MAHGEMGQAAREGLLDEYLLRVGECEDADNTEAAEVPIVVMCR